MAAYEFRNDKGTLVKLELMLNNEERSDTVFLVNNARYHVWSHLVAMNSTVLEALMKEYFTPYEDREIKILNAKHEDSFYLVLQYMYGVKMNFAETNINIICEALYLAERFEMADFSKELKQFVSTKIDGFDIEAVITLLNTSRKYNLNDLYKKVSEYAYKNAEQLVKLASFIQLQYEVLVDLLKSDWFFAKEIEILTGVLTWHNDMDVTRGELNADATMSVKENVLKSLLSHIRAIGITLVDHANAFKNELFIKYKDNLADYKHFSQSTQPRKKFASPAIVASKPVVAQPLPVSLNTLKLFPTALHNMFHDVKKVFTINRLSLNTVYESKEELQIECFKLKLNLRETASVNEKQANFDISLQVLCTSDEQGDWECYTEVQVIWKPVCDRFNGYYCSNGCLHPGFKCKTYASKKYLDSQPTTFTPQNNLVSLGQFKQDLLSDLYPRFVNNNTIKLDVNIKKFHFKKMEN